MNSLSEPYKGRITVVEFGSDITCDAYELPNGEVRYSITGVSILLGYARNWFNELDKTSSNRLKALQSKGFTGSTVSVKVSREGKRGASIAKTICRKDLIILIEMEALRGNKKAYALSRASLDEICESRERVAFGRAQQTLKEKMAAFDAKVREWEAMLEENRQEVADTWLPSDELYYPDFEPGYSPRNYAD